jgi:excisionase family DNA binding protein
VRFLFLGVFEMERASLTTASSRGSMGDARYRSLTGAMLAQQQQSASLLGERLYSVAETALALNVAPSTVRAWLKSKYIQPAVRPSPRSHYRISGAEIRRLKKQVQP